MGKWSATTENKFLRLDSEVLGTYNAWDVYNTARLVAPLREQLRRTGNLTYHDGLYSPLQDAVVAMQQRGIKYDSEERNRLAAGLRKELHVCDKFLMRAHGKVTFNPNSPKQVGEWLYGTLGLKDHKKGSVDQEALTAILRYFRKKDEPHREILYHLFHRSRVKTILSRYMNINPDEDGMVRARVKMAKAKTTRFAYEDPALQQIPPEVRSMFVARPGHVFVGVDYSQLEARLMAYFANDTPSIEVFKSGGDVHEANAADLFAISTEEVTKAHRSYGKGFLYKISYGGEGSDKEKTMCPCPMFGCDTRLPPVLDLKRADKLAAEDRWFSIHHAVRTYQNELCEQVRRHYYYEHPFGGRRYFVRPWGSDVERELKNEPMQRGGSILMARAQISLHKLNAPIVLQMHDEFVLECPEDHAHMWVDTCQEVMERPINELGGVSIPTDAEWGYSWGSMKDVKKGDPE